MARLRGLLELMDEALNIDAAYEGVKRLGLKEGNTASDRAKAMGFSDDTFYHGTNRDFDEFRNIGGRGVYVADSPSTASGYAMDTTAPSSSISDSVGGVVLPLKVRNANAVTDYVNVSNPANIRSIFAKFNPRLAGVGAGSVMSADLLADENGLLSSPDRNSILGYMADSYKYMADEGGLLGNILYSGGGKALDNLSYGTTPMKKGSGRLPSTPTNESLLNLMELFQL